MTFYTRRGDDGTTGLLGEERVAKYHPRLEALGALDETSATVGLARASVEDPRCGPILLEVQRDLYRLMAEAAAAPEHAARFHFGAERVEWLEQQIDALSQSLERPREFILPGDSPAGAALALARAVTRRAERRVVALFDQRLIINPAIQRYLNRLSSLLFVLELIENRAAGKATTPARR